MKKHLLKIGVGITFVAMIVINALANILPINNVTTGEVSDSLRNLFVPAGMTFSIGGLIYLLLAFYTVYQFKKTEKESVNKLFSKINPYFAITSLANISGIFLGHYKMIGLTLIPMAIMLVCLIKIADLLRKENFSQKETYFIKVPFSIYFGGITIATIANITGFLVSIRWTGFGLLDETWTMIVLSVGAIIGITRMLRDRSIVYGMVILGAYFGIYIKHISPEGFARFYGEVITTTVIWMALITISIAYLAFSKRAKE